jgi:hypothetical protein
LNAEDNPWHDVRMVLVTPEMADAARASGNADLAKLARRFDASPEIWRDDAVIGYLVHITQRG